MGNFIHEEKFLKLNQDTKSELLSINTLEDGHELTPEFLFTKPKFTPYLLDGKEVSGRMSYLESIFVYDDDIYLYLSKSDAMISSFSCKIYYPIIKKKDVEFFILNLKKLKKNGN